MHVKLTLTPGTKTKGSSSILLRVHEHNWLIPLCPPSIESLLRMKEETAEVDEFTFSQGTSDQESNGSGSYYIKQEP